MHQSLIPLNGWTGIFFHILDIWLDGCRTVGKYYMYKDYKSLKVNPALDPVNLLLEKEYFSSAGPATVFAGAASAAAAVPPSRFIFRPIFSEVTTRGAIFPKNNSEELCPLLEPGQRLVLVTKGRQGLQRLVAYSGPSGEACCASPRRRRTRRSSCPTARCSGL